MEEKNKKTKTSPSADQADDMINDNDPSVNSYERFRRKIFKMVSVGVVDIFINQFYDVLSTSMLVINLIITVMNTYESLRSRYSVLFDSVELITVVFFCN